MDKQYKVTWSQTALDELYYIVAYPSEGSDRRYQI
jgi:hypothetical protein